MTSEFILTKARLALVSSLYQPKKSLNGKFLRSWQRMIQCRRLLLSCWSNRAKTRSQRHHLWDLKRHLSRSNQLTCCCLRQAAWIWTAEQITAWMGIWNSRLCSVLCRSASSRTASGNDIRLGSNFKARRLPRLGCFQFWSKTCRKTCNYVYWTDREIALELDLLLSLGMGSA